MQGNRVAGVPAPSAVNHFTKYSELKDNALWVLRVKISFPLKLKPFIQDVFKRGHLAESFLLLISV